MFDVKKKKHPKYLPGEAMHVETSIYTTLPRYNIASVDDSTMYTKVNFMKEKKETAQVVV